MSAPSFCLVLLSVWFYDGYQRSLGRTLLGTVSAEAPDESFCPAAVPLIKHRSSFFWKVKSCHQRLLREERAADWPSTLVARSARSAYSRNKMMETNLGADARTMPRSKHSSTVHPRSAAERRTVYHCCHGPSVRRSSLPQRTSTPDS